MEYKEEKKPTKKKGLWRGKRPRFDEGTEVVRSDAGASV
jgi:hypothetical protein